jgi:hypothetical protein
MIFDEPIVVAFSLGKRKSCDLPFKLHAVERLIVCTQQGKHAAVTFAITGSGIGDQPRMGYQRFVCHWAEQLLCVLDEEYLQSRGTSPDSVEFLKKSHEICARVMSKCLNDHFFWNGIWHLNPSSEVQSQQSDL